MGTAIILYGFPSSNYLRRFLGYVDHTRVKFVICQGPLFFKSFFFESSCYSRCEKKKSNSIARVIVKHVGNSLNKMFIHGRSRKKIIFFL